MNTLLRSLFLLIAIGAALPALAQDTTQLAPPDSITVQKNGEVTQIESYAARYDPRRALLLAAVLPSAGQMYNNKWWKVPLVWGGFAGLGYGVAWNQERYLENRTAVFSLLNDKNPVIVDQATGRTAMGNIVIGNTVYYELKVGPVSLDVARQRVNKFRRDRDYMVIMSFIFYMMQMIDAHVDAHLKEFDLNPMLKVSLEPVMNQNAFTGRSTGVGLTLRF